MPDSPRDTAPAPFKSLQEWLEAMPQLDAINYELRKGSAIRAWALDHIGVNFDVGDKVVLSGLRIKDGSGWSSYREAMADGSTATVTAIDFNAAHNYWYADIVLDREWATSSDGKYGPFWHGPVAETPEGMDPPSPFDQDRYPNGRKHTFSMPVEYLSRFAEEALSA